MIKLWLKKFIDIFKKSDNNVIVDVFETVTIKEKDKNMATRKTFDVSTFVNRLNNILNDDSVMQIQKESICAIVEGVLESTNNKYSYTTNGDTFNRFYTIG